MPKYYKKAPNKALASRLRHYVTFQGENDVSDGEGGFTTGWADLHVDVPSEVLDIQAVRKEEMRSLNVVATHYIRIRALINIDEVGRCVWVDETGATRNFILHSSENVRNLNVERFIIAEEIRD